MIFMKNLWLRIWDHHSDWQVRQIQLQDSDFMRSTDAEGPMPCDDSHDETKDGGLPNLVI